MTKQTINIGEYTITHEVVNGALVTTVEQVESSKIPEDDRKYFIHSPSGKKFYIGQVAVIVKNDDYRGGLDPDLRRAGYKIGDKVKVVNHDRCDWPIIDGVICEIDPASLEPIN